LEVNHRRAAVARIEWRLNLDQAAELSAAQLQYAIEPSHMSTAD